MIIIISSTQSYLASLDVVVVVWGRVLEINIQTVPYTQETTPPRIDKVSSQREQTRLKMRLESKVRYFYRKVAPSKDNQISS